MRHIIKANCYIIKRNRVLKYYLVFPAIFSFVLIFTAIPETTGDVAIYNGIMQNVIFMWLISSMIFINYFIGKYYKEKTINYYVFSDHNRKDILVGIGISTIGYVLAAFNIAFIVAGITGKIHIKHSMAVFQEKLPLMLGEILFFELYAVVVAFMIYLIALFSKNMLIGLVVSWLLIILMSLTPVLHKINIAGIYLDHVIGLYVLPTMVSNHCLSGKVILAGILHITLFFIMFIVGIRFYNKVELK